MRRLSRPPLLAALAACAAACAAHGRVAQAECRLRLVVGLDQVPDAALVRELARESGARLDVMSSIAPGRLYAMSLVHTGAAPDCEEAVRRLRAAPHVRSVELDQHRKHHAPQ